MAVAFAALGASAYVYKNGKVPPSTLRALETGTEDDIAAARRALINANDPALTDLIRIAQRSSHLTGRHRRILARILAGVPRTELQNGIPPSSAGEARNSIPLAHFSEGRAPLRDTSLDYAPAQGTTFSGHSSSADYPTWPAPVARASSGPRNFSHLQPSSSSNNRQAPGPPPRSSANETADHFLGPDNEWHLKTASGSRYDDATHYLGPDNQWYPKTMFAGGSKGKGKGKAPPKSSGGGHGGGHGGGSGGKRPEGKGKAPESTDYNKRIR